MSTFTTTTTVANSVKKLARPRRGADGEPVVTPKRSQSLGKWVLGLLTNLLTKLEKHGQHSHHGKDMVNGHICCVCVSY